MANSCELVKMNIEQKVAEHLASEAGVAMGAEEKDEEEAGGADGEGKEEEGQEEDEDEEEEDKKYPNPNAGISETLPAEGA